LDAARVLRVRGLFKTGDEEDEKEENIGVDDDTEEEEEQPLAQNGGLNQSVFKPLTIKREGDLIDVKTKAKKVKKANEFSEVKMNLNNEEYIKT